MTRPRGAAVASVALAAVLLVALHAQNPPARSKRTTGDVTVTGCLVQGSGPSVFILDHARLDPRDTTEQEKTYLLIASASEVDLRPNLNHEVRVSGAADPARARVRPPGRTTDEDTLPRFHVKILLPTADRCL